MKLLHTSDWHVGHTLYTHERRDEHNHFFARLARFVEEEQPDAMLVCGDIFHYSSPSASAQKLFTEGLHAVCRACPTMEVFVTSGNHDSALRLDADATLWREFRVHIVTSTPRDPQQYIHVVEGKGIVACVPYFNPYHYNTAEVFDAVRAEVRQLTEGGDASLPVVLMAHLALGSREATDLTGHMDGVGGMDFVSSDVVCEGFDYVALGHIHCPQTIRGTHGRARYCGTPFALTFDEAQHQHCVDIVEVRHGEEPEVRSRDVGSPVRLLTIPEKPAPLQEVLTELRLLADDDDSFVQPNVLVADILEPNANALVDDIVRDKACRRCPIKISRAGQQTANGPQMFRQSIDIHKTKPTEIARLAYQTKHKMPMPDELAEMLDMIAKEVVLSN